MKGFERFARLGAVQAQMQRLQAIREACKCLKPDPGQEEQYRDACMVALDSLFALLNRWSRSVNTDADIANMEKRG